MAIKQSQQQFSPDIFDLSQDIVEYVPSEIVENWLNSDYSDESAKRILGASRVKGVLVSTDSSGLSKMSVDMDIIEVMSLVSEPKEVIHAYGASVGGSAVGVWAADNTQMLYPENIDACEILKTVVSARDYIKKNCKVQVGFAIHYGEFYKVGNGMYGVDADIVEGVAEDFVEGGEIVVSSAFVKRLGTCESCNLAEKKDLPERFGHFQIVTNCDAKAKLPASGSEYPLPFSKDFFDRIVSLRKLSDSRRAEVLAEIRDKHIRNKFVTLIERSHANLGAPEHFVLDELALYGVMGRTALHLLMDYEGKRVKTLGNLGIYVFSSADEVIDFTMAFRVELKRFGIASKAGISHGDILLFDLSNGRRDIAGVPVNLASKVAQDHGEFGRIYLIDDMVREAVDREMETMEIEVVGARIKCGII